MAPQLIRRRVSALARRAGLGDRRVNPRNLRHSLACELSERGWPLESIARQLGSTSVEATKVAVADLRRLGAAARIQRWKAEGQEPTRRQLALMRLEEIRSAVGDINACTANPVRSVERIREIANRRYD